MATFENNAFLKLESLRFAAGASRDCDGLIASAEKIHAFLTKGSERPATVTTRLQHLEAAAGHISAANALQAGT